MSERIAYFNKNMGRGLALVLPTRCRTGQAAPAVCPNPASHSPPTAHSSTPFFSSWLAFCQAARPTAWTGCTKAAWWPAKRQTSATRHRRQLRLPAPPQPPRPRSLLGRVHRRGALPPSPAYHRSTARIPPPQPTRCGSACMLTPSLPSSSRWVSGGPLQGLCRSSQALCRGPFRVCVGGAPSGAVGPRGRACAAGCCLCLGRWQCRLSMACTLCVCQAGCWASCPPAVAMQQVGQRLW